MTTVFVVTYQMCKKVTVIGVYTDPHVAHKLRTAIGVDAARVTPIKLDSVFPEFADEMQGLDDICNKGLKQLELNKFELGKAISSPMNPDYLDEWLETIMHQIPRD